MMGNQIIRLLYKHSFPLFLLGLTIVTYGLLAPFLGFYLDDWYIIFYQKQFGGAEFLQFFQEDRPFFGYVYMIFLPIFQDSQTAWQLFAVFTRWLATLSFWFTSTHLFPKYAKILKWASVLFLVYPGFQFHWFAIMYSQAYLLLAIYFLSYYFMFKAFTERSKRSRYLLFTAVALISEVIGIVPMEYYYGFEFARPFVFYLLLRQEDPKPAKILPSTLLHWLPYLGIFGGFTVFRVLYSSNYSYQISILSRFGSQPFQTILAVAKQIIQSVLDAVFVAWGNAASLLDIKIISRTSAAMVVLMIGSAAFTFLFLNKRKNQGHDPAYTPHAWGVMLGGLALIIFALAPFIAASFIVSLDFPNNRFLLSLAPGVGVFIAGTLDEFLRTEKQKVIALALLTGLAVGSQFMVSRGFYLQWLDQIDFFWQLTWRAPGLKAGTALVSEDLPFVKYSSGNSLSAPLNLIYSPDNKTHQLNNLIMLISSPQGDAIPDYAPGNEINYSFRHLDFSGNTSSMIIFYQPENGCLRLLSPEVSSNEFANSPRHWFWDQAIPLSNLDQIITDPETPAAPPRQYFGTENTNQWCYYYEKADLARQQENWVQVIDYFDQADEKGLKPSNKQELLPLIEAYLQTGQIDLANNTVTSLSKSEVTKLLGACKLFNQMESTYPKASSDGQLLIAMSKQFNCGE